MTMMKTGVSSPPENTNDNGNIDLLGLDEDDSDTALITPSVGEFNWNRYSMFRDRVANIVALESHKEWEVWEKSNGVDRKDAPSSVKTALEARVEARVKLAISPVLAKMVDEVYAFYRNHWGFPFQLKSRDTIVMCGNPEIDKATLDNVDILYKSDLAKYTKLAWRLRNFNSKGLLVGYDYEAEHYKDGEGLFGMALNDMTQLSRELEWNALGMGTANAFMPHLHKCPVKGMTSPYDGFYGTGPDKKSEKYLKKAIMLALRFDTGAMPSSIRYGLRSIGGIQSVGNFKPTVAKFLWERYTPDDGGIVYDYSCGWGGRLTGARSSKKNLTYVGVDPSTETFDCLTRLDAFLCDVYKGEYKKGEVTNLPSGHREYRSNLVRITEIGSEDFCPPDLHGKVDFAFSSPPYFDLEQYGDNSDAQSHVKFPNEDLWLNGFIKGTAANIFKMLKPGSYAGLNLADFRDTKITDGAIKVYESVGFEYMPDENYYMRISVRTGNRSIDKNVGKKHKTEPIFMFRKPV